MLIYRIAPEGAATWYTTLPQATGNRVDVALDLFERLAPTFTEYSKLLEACYKEQLDADVQIEADNKAKAYREAVEATIKEFTPTNE